MKNYNYLSSELCKLGITSKEADIYLVLLELGYCSVQKIAQKLELSRPTVYRFLKSLKKKNLINTVQRGKKSYFIAGSPDTLLNMLQIKKRQAEEQEREFLRIISILQDQYSFSSKENSIETFSDKKMRLAWEKLSNSQFTDICIFFNFPSKDIDKTLATIKKRSGSSLKIRQIHSFKMKNGKKDYIESKFLENNLTNENVVITDKIFIFEKNSIQIVKQKNIVASYKSMFEALWKNI